MTHIEPEQNIESLQDLLRVMSRLRGLHSADTSSPLAPREEQFALHLRKSPYSRRGRSLDLWFRGEPDADRLLAPGSFREKALGHQEKDVFYEETSATFHFMLRRPEFRSQCESDFEWLSLFQHYGGLTRLLDWSENALVAAFFAVQEGEHDRRDANLFVLNAALLNSQTGLVHDTIPAFQSCLPVQNEGHMGIRVATSPDVILRSAQAFCRTDYEWRARIDSVLKSGLRAELRWLTAALELMDEAAEGPCKTAEREKIAARLHLKLSYPVAVFPPRSNVRLVAQSGMFTLHGGKGKVEAKGLKDRDRLPPPFGIEQLALQERSDPWILRYRIPYDMKGPIREQLQAIGIHRSTLFPEVQSDGEIMRDLWCR